MKFGYHYSIVNDIENNYKVAQDLVLKTFELLGLGFGRADVGYNSKKKSYILFEINTSPGLNVNTAELYATHLRMVINV
jgi:D-alanine-D-alanine ligase-like ATP-grasp enzyme